MKHKIFSSVKNHNAKQHLLFLLLVLLAAGGGFLLVTIPKPQSQKSENNGKTITPVEPTQSPVVDIQASFAIFTNNTFRTFTLPMYHNLSNDVYITAQNPNIVFIRKEGITWDDFFSTLPFSLTKNCLTTGTNETFCTEKTKILKFFLNGQRDDDALTKKISPADQLLVTFGPEDDNTIEDQLKKIPVLPVTVMM